MPQSPIQRGAWLVLAMATAGCGGAKSGPDTAPAPTQSTDFETLYRARTDSARMRFTDADVDFMTGMIVHHAQALVMADLAPTHGASPSVATLCRRILNAQRDEIATMQGWLRDRGQTVPEVHIEGLNLTVPGVPEHFMHMPGILSQAKLEELDAARGPEFDRLFLTYMIQHHQGAVTMVHNLFGTDGAGQDELAFKLANDIQVDQLTEIARMQLMLEQMAPQQRGQ